jgi:hypothetical protein
VVRYGPNSLMAKIGPGASALVQFEI